MNFQRTVLEYLQLPSLAQRHIYLRGHPDLLTRDSARVLAEISSRLAADARAGDISAARHRQYCDYIASELEKCREVGPEEAFAEFSFEEEVPPGLRDIYAQTRELASRLSTRADLLSSLPRDWLECLTHPDFERLPTFLRALAIANAAVCTLKALRAGHQGAEQIAALRHMRVLLEQVVEQYANTPRKGRLLNTLGECLAEEFALDGHKSGLSNAVRCHERAVELTPVNSPRRLMHLAALARRCNELFRLELGEKALARAVGANEQLLAVCASEGLDTNTLASQWCQFADLMRAAYEATGATSHLERALAAAQAGLQFGPKDADVRGALHSMAARLHYLRYRFETGRIQDLQLAHSGFDLALCEVHDAALRATILLQLGDVLCLEWRDAGDRKALELWQETAAQALQLCESGNDRATALGNQVRAEVEAAPPEARLGALDEAIERLEEAGRHATSKEIEVSVQSLLGSMLHERFDTSGDLTDLDRAMRATEAALESTPGPSPVRALRLNDIGVMWRERFDREGEFGHLQKAIDAHRRALDECGEASGTDRALLHHNLAFCLRQAYQVNRDRKVLEDAVRHHEKGLELCPPGGRDRAMHLSDLASAYLERFWAQSGEGGDLARAIEARREALQLVPEGSQESIALRHQLAAALGTVLNSTSAEASVDEVRALFRGAATDGLDLHTTESLIASRNWLEWTFAREDWHGVEEAHGEHLRAAMLLRTRQLSASAQESWLRDSVGLAARAAFACTKLDRLAAAVRTLERNQAQFLTDSLQLASAQLDRLAAQGRPDLRDRLQLARKRWLAVWNARRHAIEHDSEVWVQDARRSKQELELSLEAIRREPGFETFLQPATGRQLRAAGPQHPLVYLAYTPAGGLALVAWDADLERIEPVWLPALTEHELAVQIGRTGSPLAPDSYFGAYERLRRHQDDPEAWKTWCAVLDRVTGWLWQAAMGPMLDAVSGRTQQVTLVPTGILAMLPLHAAWTGGITAAQGRRYVLDDIELHYVPNAAVLDVAALESQKAPAERLLAIEEPAPVSLSPLPAVALEVGTCAPLFLHTQLLRGEVADRDSVLALLPECNVAHFACHGRARFDAPLESGLVMANDEVLSVRDFLSVPSLRARLAVLSACEAGTIGLMVPDEAIGLASSLLHAGFAGAVAPLWQVLDESTALLMMRFYREWRVGGRQPASALRDAQRWLRDTTNTEKVEFLTPLLKQLETGGEPTKEVAVVLGQLIDRLSRRQAGLHYAHPVHWAAFTYIGV